MSAFWKDQAPYALCITHDVDRIEKQWYHYGYYALYEPGMQFRSFRKRISGTEPYWNFYTLMEQELALQVRSTFLFLNEPVRRPTPAFMGRYKMKSARVRGVILELDRNGFEIGLHGSFYSYNQLERLRAEKMLLEDLLGHSVVSTRQHHLNFDEKATWRMQREIGLRFDSTLGYADKLGIGFPTMPFRTNEGMWEMPITLMDTIAMDTQAKRSSILQGCNHRGDSGGLVMLNFHQCHYNDLEYPQNVSVYTRLLHTAIERKAWVAPMKEIGEWMEKNV